MKRLRPAGVAADRRPALITCSSSRSRRKTCLPPPIPLVPVRADIHVVAAVCRTDGKGVERMSRIDEPAFGPQQQTAHASILHDLCGRKFHQSKGACETRPGGGSDATAMQEPVRFGPTGGYARTGRA